MSTEIVPVLFKPIFPPSPRSGTDITSSQQYSFSHKNVTLFGYQNQE